MKPSAKSFIQCLLIVALTIPEADASQPRSKSIVREFQREHPCPANNKRRGPCPGYQADHIKPLCAGGHDALHNLQWLTIEAHRAKTREDVKTCSVLRRNKPTP